MYENIIALPINVFHFHHIPISEDYFLILDGRFNYVKAAISGIS